MWGRATSPLLTVTVLAALWVSVGRCGASQSPGPGCDNGKLSLDRDLPAASLHWDCPVSTWTQPIQRRPSIDTVYDPEPARLMCMNKPICYNHTIPNSGAYRPVRAESGEYLYCPPHRWLNNLHQGATVLLYHPCAPLHERHFLSVLARSCLSEYIITPHPHLNQHMPIALVSWGRTLELSTVASSDVCDWLETLTTTGNELSGVNHIRKYDLLLARPAKLHRLQHTHPEEHSTQMKDSVRQCCEQAVSSLLNEAVEAELESNRRNDSLTEIEKEGKGRQIRAVIRETQPANETGDIQNNNTTLGQSEDTPGNRTLADPPGPSEAPPQSNIQNLNQSLTAGQMTPLGSNVPEVSDSLELKTSDSQKSLITIQKETLQLTSKHTEAKNRKPSAQTEVLSDVVNSEDNLTARPEALDLSPKDEGTDSAEHSGRENGSKEKSYIAADRKLKGNEVVDVKERELVRKQTHSEPHSHHKSENNGVDSVSKSQSASPPLPDSTKASAADVQATVMSNGWPRTPRTDEAVWAAAALGFLLVLLTLSVLHTRLYRHWRTTPSLYWHDPRQDYDSVADIIRRRLRLAKRRRKRGRRKECVLLPSSSSSDELA
ncbi:tumor protein p53-inducible protein 13 isoform X1 [Hippoglossus hippoglossus]|uniref:tumor protein p53-inducible protein 13 isoform X1 n=1 Tax=Hippoglossus hippoglossus TaxID=8267 RepID=UPI00148C5906|nr:tumor protein p53-inducible protein 13 isoform X1 [Hippoglossus hippoglossus]